MFSSLFSSLYAHRAYYCYYQGASSQETGGRALQMLALSDLEKCALAHENNRLADFKQRLENGHQCFGHMEEGAPISYFWVTHAVGAPFDANFDFGLSIQVPEGGCYIWDCRIDPNHQRQGVYTQGLAWLVGNVTAQDFYILSQHDNPASVKGIERAGFHTRVSFAFIKIYRLLWLHMSGTSTVFKRPAFLLEELFPEPETS